MTPRHAGSPSPPARSGGGPKPSGLGPRAARRSSAPWATTTPTDPRGKGRTLGTLKPLRGSGSSRDHRQCRPKSCRCILERRKSRMLALKARVRWSLHCEQLLQNVLRHSVVPGGDRRRRSSRFGPRSWRFWRPGTLLTHLGALDDQQHARGCCALRHGRHCWSLLCYPAERSQGECRPSIRGGPSWRPLGRRAQR